MTGRRHLIGTAALVAGFVFAGPALATQSIECSGLGESAEVSLLFGAGPVPNILAVGVAAGGRVLTTQDGQPGERAFIAQAYTESDLIRVDLVDDQATKQLAAIRILRADDKSGPFQIGYVQIEDAVAIAISCEGP